MINEDRVQPAKGFPTLSIETWKPSPMFWRALAHKDSTGASSIIRAGDAQRMSAGTGISHSEYNPSLTETGALLQIWIVPNQAGLAPS